MAKKDGKMQHLNIFLIKANILKFEDALRDKKSAGSMIPFKKRTFEATLCLPKTIDALPAWAPFLQEGFGTEAKIGKNRSTSALLFIRAQNRIFALTFGHARNLLLPEACEFDFGLRVVVNCVDPARIRSISLKMFKEMTVKRYEEAAKGTQLHTFGVDIRQDLLRAVTGQPERESFAARVSGADSLVIDVPLKFGELGSKCGEVLTAYEDTGYQRRGFKWIDNLKPVRDPSLIHELDKELLAILKSSPKRPEIQLIAPDSFTREAIIGFRFADESIKSELHPELEIEDWKRSLGDGLRTLEVEGLRTRRIRGCDDQGEYDEVVEYFFFSGEIKFDNKIFVLSSGQWFEISRDLLKDIGAALERITRQAINLPPSAKNLKTEDQYVEYVDKNQPDIMSMHKKTFRVGGSAVEPCDLLSKDGHLIHVKCWCASSTFSHLLRQGAVSAETLLRVPVARKHVRDKAEKHKTAIAGLFPEDNYEPANLEVIFALIQKPNAQLPFFSRLSLMRESEQIEHLGYKVAFQPIPR